MKKRTFLKLTSALMTAPIILPLVSWLPGDKLKNWAGNLTYSTDKVYYPASVTEVQELVKKYDKLKVLGTRHCFNDIADSKDNLVSTKQLNKIISLEEDAKTVTVEAGIKYGELAPYLDSKGFALHNLASLPHISVAGAITTATHGSGVKNGNLSTAVAAIEFVSADGTLHNLSKTKDGERFNAAVVGLGAIGVLTKVTLNLVPTFTMRQYVYEQLPMAVLNEHFEEIVAAGYSVSLFTDWQSGNINEVWIKTKDGDEMKFDPKADFFGAKAATKNMHPIAALSAENCTEQMGVSGPWYERLPHFKMGFTPSSGVELQAEYFIPKQHAVEAIFAIAKLGKEIGPHLFITEIRTMAADDLWMSPCYKQDSVTIHFTLKQEIPEVMNLLPVIEKALEPFKAKPHWGKLFTHTHAQLANRHKKMHAFVGTLKDYDPKGKFRNAFLDRNIYGV
ncbi:FAD-binding protein [Panacibacter ginsenosidivorans]|uniref:FAD-binding protein n=1 Tax=Panacibacter ginsenosidivorans TaxID=1813871 RepID=A0A5B8V7Y4_9BACT|nr:FAD-binding protein [Panacibacter ginsenosidivorans]QEC66931.1 FAD-binding protein [Panacibacter ginsenosidivorans]